MKPIQTDWQIRHFIYKTWAISGRAPNTGAIAATFAISKRDSQRALQRLHDAHALVLDAASGDILMAHPLSAAPTDYRVTVNDLSLYANCAWDSLGIPAMLDCDAHIEAWHPLTRDLTHYHVYSGRLHGDDLVHFARPFRHWYDDIVDT